MCPICWATALVSFGGIVAVSVVSLAGNDKLILALAAVLGTMFLLSYLDIATAPWYVAAVLIGVIVVRISYLLVFRWKELPPMKAWSMARQIAARRCTKTRS
jgi:hypothetical protein